MLRESNRIELKATLNDKLEKEIVAFLNNREGGILYIGIDDKGNPIENSDTDSMQLKIADRIKNNILLFIAYIDWKFISAALQCSRQYHCRKLSRKGKFSSSRI